MLFSKMRTVITYAYDLVKPKILQILKKCIQKAFQTSFYQDLFFQKVCSLTYYNKGSPVSLSI